MYGYNSKSLGSSLKLCPFSRVIAVGSPLGSMICLPKDFWPSNSDPYWFHLVEQDINLTIKGLTISRCMSHQWEYLAIPLLQGSQLGKRDHHFSQLVDS